ncbi:MAG: aminotransferase class I/II-fold pyridoxal phosphate-dependent enzyme, partial [Pseudomonadota bacterium]
WARHSAVQNEVWRDWLTKELAAAGIPSDPAFANFVLARFADAETAGAADAALRARGVIVRPVASYGLPAALRITVGREDACQIVAGTLTDFMAERAA